MADTAVETTTEETTETTTEDWRTGLPEDIRDHASLKDLDGVGALATKLIHAESLVGADKIAIPGKNADQKTKDDFYAKLGRPEKPEGYEVPTENMPEEIALDNEQISLFRAEAYRIGLTAEQAASMIRFDAHRTGSALKEMDESTVSQVKETLEQLQKDWGDAYEQNSGIAKHGLREIGGTEMAEWAEETGLGNDIRFIKFCYNVGRALASDEVKGMGGAYGFKMSPEDAKRKIDQMKADDEHNKNRLDAGRSGHKLAVKEWEEAFKIGYPG